MSVAAAWLPSVLSALAERLASLWPFLLPVGALILAVAGLSLAQEASYYRTVDRYRETVGAVVGRAWTIGGADAALEALATLPCPGETMLQRRRRRRLKRPSEEWQELEAVAIIRDPNFGQHVESAFLTAPSEADGLYSVAERLSAWHAAAGADRNGLPTQIAGGLAVTAGSSFIVMVRQAPPPIRLWWFRRWA